MEQPVLILGEEADREKCAQLTARLNIPVAEPNGQPLYLLLDKTGLSLHGENLHLQGDYTQMLPRLKYNNLTHEMLIKAAKIKGLEPGTAVDATAGMGEDSLLLAAFGFRVILFEHNPIIAALLRDTLERAAGVPELADIVSRMELREGSSVEGLQALDYTPDVVLLDPMFPPRQKSSLVTKKLQLLQKLELPCSEEAVLLNAALAAGPRRIVIKRPAKGPYLAGVKPAYSLDGKAVRYDCIVPPRK